MFGLLAPAFVAQVPLERFAVAVGVELLGAASEELAYRS
jgi:hypothetical protein